MSAPQPLRVAVIGVGHLGRVHARIYSELPGVRLCFIVDVDAAKARAAAAKYGAEARSNHRDVLGRVDAVSVVTPTTSHHEVARDFLESGAAVLVEKPMTATVAEADGLIQAAARRGLVLQVGHVERFNPAYVAIRDVLGQPAFIECHRLGPYSFRSTDISVVLDLMIHDLDLILDIAGAPASSVEAAGVPILSKTTDIANARLRFNRPDGSPGCIANVTASRVSPKPMRRLRVFQRDAYVSMDLLQKTVYVFRKKEGFDVAHQTPEKLATLAAGLPSEVALAQLLDIRQIHITQTDALKEELMTFVRSVREKTPPPVTGEHGRRALELAVAIDADIDRFLLARRP